MAVESGIVGEKKEVKKGGQSERQGKGSREGRR